MGGGPSLSSYNGNHYINLSEDKPDGQLRKINYDLIFRNGYN
jgi:hypothetical protein